jgi:dethiobiotin synthetase
LLKGLFITGTDTGVGKTVISATLAYALRRKGIDFGYLKPIETGIPDTDYLNTFSDAALVKAAGRLSTPMPEIVPFRFREPLAPLLAARREGVSLSATTLKKTIRHLCRNKKFFLVEGAGGLLAPLCPDYLVLDLIRDLGLPVLVVSRTGLGAVNHSLLTLERIRRENLRLIGLAASHFSSSPSLAEREFISQLSEFDPVPIVGELPFLDPGPVRDRDWEKLAGHLEVERILELLQ